MKYADRKMHRLLKGALSHPDRKEILGYLMGRAGPMSEGDLARVLDIGEAKVKYHLTVLRDAELVMQVEEGQGQGEHAYVAAGMAGSGG